MDLYQTEHLDMVFKQVAKLHHHTVHRLLADKELFPGQIGLLRALAGEDGLSQRELADRMRITPATLNVMIGRMEKGGFIERKSDPLDQRLSRVYITDKGREAHLESRAFVDTMERICFETFSVEERIIFRRLLLQMYENLKKAMPEQEDEDNRSYTKRKCDRRGEPR